ncbi:MAG: hypothetical protein RL153_882, partial [Verrucomicrobiota bacterium]
MNLGKESTMRLFFTGPVIKT